MPELELSYQRVTACMKAAQGRDCRRRVTTSRSRLGTIPSEESSPVISWKWMRRMGGRDRMTGPQQGKSRKGGGRRSLGRTLGLGLVTGAADDDPSAIGTYASAGAQLGHSFLWAAPLTLPMMFAVVYLSAKLGQVSGRGLFQVIKEHYPRWVL